MVEQLSTLERQRMDQQHPEAGASSKLLDVGGVPSEVAAVAAAEANVGTGEAISRPVEFDRLPRPVVDVEHVTWTPGRTNTRKDGPYLLTAGHGTQLPYSADQRQAYSNDDDRA